MKNKKLEISLKNSEIKKQHLWHYIKNRMVFNWLFVLLMWFLFVKITPAPPEQHLGLGVLATILGLLSTGIFTAYNSLSIIDAPKSLVPFFNFINTILFISIYLLLYIAVYCLYLMGVFSSNSSFIAIVLHISLGFLLSIMHLVDVWDRVQCDYTIKNE